ncbi:MAG: 3-dehydroquinate dehydratase [Bacteroidia bacterium]|nr:3-dehydroquinate dehydratase [Bacteroidia bacterium]
MNQRILIINGPNLNWVGTREPEVYGNQNLEEYLNSLAKELATSNQVLAAEQSNLEGEIINLLQAAEKNPNTIGVIINAGGYSHTSLAISDTIRAMSKKVIAVHISNTFDRDIERHKDLVAAASDGFIGGFGLDGYRLALVSLGVGV